MPVTVEELVRRLQMMLASHSDSVEWYRNAIKQALRRAEALPEPLTFEEER